MKNLIKTVLVSLVVLFVLNVPTAFAADASSVSNGTTEAYQKAKKDWQTLRDTLKTRRTITAAEKSQAFEKAKAMVTKAIERAVARLNKLIQRIQKMKVITEERKTKLISDLQNQVTALNELKTKVEATENKAELKEVVGDAKSKFIETRALIKKVVAEILTSHIDKTIAKLNTIVSKLETEITALKAKGQDVTDFEKTLTEAKTLLTQAADKNESGNWKEARKLAEQARAKLAKLAGQIKAAKAKLEGGTSEGE